MAPASERPATWAATEALARRAREAGKDIPEDRPESLPVAVEAIRELMEGPPPPPKPRTCRAEALCEGGLDLSLDSTARRFGRLFLAFVKSLSR